MGNTNLTEGIAQIRSSDGILVHGYINFKEPIDGGDILISGKLEYLHPGKHGMHIHSRGNVLKCCSALGDHYNPDSETNHGDRLAKDFFGNYQRHLGDLGNITVKKDGVCNFSFTDELIKIRGDHSIIGRSIVIHANEDDLGLTDHPDSKTTGNSGARIAYGIIGYA